MNKISPFQLSLVEDAAVSVPVLPKFGTHQGSPAKLLWFRRIYDKVLDNPFFFSIPDAEVVRFHGLTPKLLKIMGYWGRAYKIISLQQDGSDAPTAFANFLMGEHGVDPYLESSNIWWLLHWKLFRPPCYAPGFWAIFNNYNFPDFKESDLKEAIERFRHEISPFQQGKIAINLDVQAFLRTYLPDKCKSIEDEILHPFWGLRLISILDSTEKDRLYRFNLKFESVPKAEASILLAACLDYALEHYQGHNSFPMSTLAYAPGSPGRVFKVSESVIEKSLDYHFDGIGGAYDANFKPLLTWEGDAKLLINNLVRISLDDSTIV